MRSASGLALLPFVYFLSWTSAFKLFLDIFNDWLYCLVYLMSWTSAFKLFLDILFNDLDLGVHALAFGLALLPFVFFDLDLGVQAF